MYAIRSYYALDQVGPITRDVTDAAMMLNLMGGHDPKDSTSAPEQMPDFRITSYNVCYTKLLRMK